MADKTINQLDTIESIANDDKLPIWDTSTSSTGKISRENFLSGYQPELTFDTAPTPESTNPVTSGGIFTSNAIITASSTTITNAPVISNGSVIRIMFTSTISGSDTSTAMSLTYNGIPYSVKIGKNGSLTNFVATETDNNYYYLQAYTTLELTFDGNQFIIIGNPVVLSSDDYTIYADGNKIKILRRKQIDVSGSDVNYQNVGNIYQYSALIDNNFGANELVNCAVLDTADYSSWIMNYGIINDKIQVRIGRPTDTSGYAIKIILYYYK